MWAHILCASAFFGSVAALGNGEGAAGRFAAQGLNAQGFNGFQEPPPRQNKIDHFVVLYMENHAADAFFGCMDLPGFDGIKGHTLPVDPMNKSKGSFNVTCDTARYVCKGGPGYDTFAGKFPAKGANPHSYPYSPQSDINSGLHGASEGGTAVRMFAPEQIPIKATLARNFGVFNKMYTAVPSASSPNHLMTQSATSCGMQSNSLYNDCGGKDVFFPQATMYDSMWLHNVSFGIYMNSTCGIDGKPCHGEDPHDPDSASAISTPDVAMTGVADHADRFFSQTAFYEQAANGTLPQFTWLLPPIQACDHPCHDIAKGERMLKDVYEALRNGPGWENTMLLVTYDDAGGFYDHMVPPFEGVPADEAPCHIDGKTVPHDSRCGADFDFRRLGLRTTGFLVSPWVGKGVVFQEPKGPTNTSQFDLTSIPATVKNLFNLSTFLTKRDAWAGSFDELLLDTPRTDLPLHLPEAPPASSPWDPVPPTPDADGSGNWRPVGPAPPHDDRYSDGRRRQGQSTDGRRRYGEAPQPQHCSSPHGEKEQECKGPRYANLKQRRNVRLFASMANLPTPDLEKMTFSDADQWLTTHWRHWMERNAVPVNEKAQFV